MKHLLGQEGIRALEAFGMANTLFAFDYDGTLAPIVDDPMAAVMRRETNTIISKLAQYAPVAVISGRARSDVAKFLPPEVDFIVGNHGLEGIPGGAASLDQAESTCRKWIDALAKHSNPEGVSIENKKYSLSIHYRMSPDKRKAKSEILERVASLTPSPRIVMGKCVVNLVSPGAPHKGVALLELMLRCGCRSAVYFGDDDNDEDVFRLGEESLLTIRIGEDANSAALYFLRSQQEVDKVLGICIDSAVQSGRSRRDATSLRELLDG